MFLHVVPFFSGLAVGMLLQYVREWVARYRRLSAAAKVAQRHFQRVAEAQATGRKDGVHDGSD